MGAAVAAMPALNGSTAAAPAPLRRPETWLLLPPRALVPLHRLPPPARNRLKIVDALSVLERT